MKSSWSIIVLTVFFLFAGMLSACDSSTIVDPPPGGGNGDLDVPTFYSFPSRFADTNSVAYPEAVVYNLLVQDVMLKIEQAASDSLPVSQMDFLARYTSVAGLDIITSTTPAPAVLQYAEITTPPSLADLLSESLANQPLIGRSETADDLVRAYLAKIAMNTQVDSVDSAAVYTTAEGIDMKQMVHALLLGAAIYAQGMGHYLSTDVLSNAGTTEEPGEPATELARMWDRAFGYFGAARQYAGFSDENLADGIVYIDANGNNAIDFTSEYNFAFAEFAGAHDASGEGVNFTNEIFDAFLRGRTAIVNQRPLEEILAQRDRIREAWERVLAAHVVHFLNGIADEIRPAPEQVVANKSNAALNARWSGAKGYSYALQFNPDAIITDVDLVNLHELLGEAPPYVLQDTASVADSVQVDSLQGVLRDAKGILQDAYGFSDGNMARW